MTMNTRIAVTNRTICYELYKQAGSASAEDTPLTCLSRQICALLNSDSYDKILIREKDLSEEEYHTFIAGIFSAQHSYPSAANLTSNIIVHNFPAIAEAFGTDLHLPFSVFTDLLGHSGYSVQNNFLSDRHALTHSTSVVTSGNTPTYGISVVASENALTHSTPVATSENALTHGTSVASSYNGLTHGNTIVSVATPSNSFREKYPHIQRIGTSIHSVEDAVFAESHGADYITAGHIFTTDCKKGLPGRGVDWLKSICNAVSIPMYAIGGISDANVSMLCNCNIAGYCMMSASMKPILSE